MFISIVFIWYLFRFSIIDYLFLKTPDNILIMNSRRERTSRHHLKKEKKLIKLIKANSESEGDVERELSYYLNDRVKMMKEVLKIIKPKKIRSMAPQCMKNMAAEELNSMLLEELLGISNKRLRYIFNGQSLNEESSSTDPEDQAIDLISLDDISDDDLVIDLDSDHEKKGKRHKHKTKIKEEPKKKKVKKEKHDKEPSSSKKTKDSNANAKPNADNPMSEKNLMSVLELLELQARARAIKSQLVLESKKAAEKEKSPVLNVSDNDEDAVVVQSPKNDEIVITSSESEEGDEGRDSFYRNSDRDPSNPVDNSVNNTETEQAATTAESATVSQIACSNNTETEQAAAIAELATVAQNACQSVEEKPQDTNDHSTTMPDIPDIPLPKLPVDASEPPSQSTELEASNTELEASNTELEASNTELETSKGTEELVTTNKDNQKLDNNSGEKIKDCELTTNGFAKSNISDKIEEDIQQKESEDNKDRETEDKDCKEDEQNRSAQNEEIVPQNENVSYDTGSKIDEKDPNDICTKSDSDSNKKESSEEVTKEEKKDELPPDPNKSDKKLKHKDKAKRKILSKLRSVKSEKELLSLEKKKKHKKKTRKTRTQSFDESEGIVIDLDDSEMDCIYLD